MKEDFLHYVWQFQKLTTPSLKTSDDEVMEIFQPGQRNGNSGPDFLNGRVRIAGIIWCGSIEIHIRASDWYRHGHENDPAYNTVVLHVVWEEDRSVYRQDGTLVPALEIQDLVEQGLVKSYRRFLNSKASLPCERFYAGVSVIRKRQMQERALMERLEEKSASYRDLLKTNGYDWELTTYQWIVKSFGFKLNNEPFLQLSRILPLRDLLKHGHSLFQLEALLFGRAGFLASRESLDEYGVSLLKEYSFLKHKFQWKSEDMPRSVWKFLRTRPGNFPTVRIAQLATVMHHYGSLFQYFVNYEHPEELKTAFRYPVSDYWQKHYDMGKVLNERISGLGEASIRNLLINAVAPLLAACSKEKQEPAYMEKSLALLESLPAESNKIVRRWKSLEEVPEDAASSQALIQLHNRYCHRKQCLRCSIGVEVLNQLTWAS